MIAGARIGSSDIFKQKAEGAKDTTPPVIQLIAKPSLVQGGHESVGTIQTVFTIVAEDNESGVANIEISIDKKPFKAYRGPFNLEKGPHSVSCRCTDNAGNQTNIMKGVTEEGNDAEVLDIQIR
jgi:hypothetical protein